MAITGQDDILALEAQSPCPVDAFPSTYALLAQGPALAPEAPALSFFLRAGDFRQPFRWSQKAWFAEITRTGNAFRRMGVQRGDVVAAVLPNLPETHWTIWGGETAGVLLAINPLLEPAMIEVLLKAAQARWVVTLAPAPGTDIWEKVAAVAPRVPGLRGVITVDPLRYLRGSGGPVLRLFQALRRPRRLGGLPVLDFHRARRGVPGEALEFAPPGSGEVASLFCTGGTTGLPKIAVRTHRTEVANALQLAAALGPEFMAPGRNLFCGLPLFHVNAQIGTGLAAWGTGAHVVLGTPQGFRAPGLLADFWSMTEHYRIIGFSGVPTVYSTLLRTPPAGHDLSSLRFGVCGAAPMPLELFERFQRETGVRILEGYGLTEGGCVSSINPAGGQLRPGSVGLRLPWQPMKAVVLDPDGRYERDAAVDEVGVLAIAGPNLIRGYLDPEHDRGLWLDLPGGPWLNTGDLGRIDADGYVWLAGRRKELIIRGGHNIDPRWIEEPLQRHPAVDLAAAVGRPDPVAGEVPVAYVQLVSGASASEEELLAHARAHIPERAAWPRRIQVVASLPTTAVGKIHKPTLGLLEMEAVLREEALACGAELTRCQASLDPRLGPVLSWAAGAGGDALAERLGAYAMRSVRG